MTIMDVWGKAKAVLTAGKSTELETANERRESLLRNRFAAIEEIQAAHREMVAHMRVLGRQAKRADGLLRHARSLFGPRYRVTRSDSIPDSYGADLYERIDLTIHQYESAVAAAGGLGAGALAGAGAWGFAATFGTASTGTAITALSGAAAHSATMAWFGGGALATGGGGMAAGGLVFGGIVFIPVLVIGIWRLNTTVRGDLKKLVTQIKAMEDELELLESSVGEFLKSIPRIRLVSDSIRSASNAFSNAWDDFGTAIYPVQVISWIYRCFRSLFTGHFLKEGEMHLLVPVKEAAIILVQAVRQPIFEVDGKVSTQTIVEVSPAL